ncbi:unknown [Firmicutes bacterium CAG:321]|jgi:hypothetical protein|nr:unknown [Firmicutes bacterium CAG:321]
MKMRTLSLNIFNSDRVVLKKSGILLCFSHTL